MKNKLLIISIIFLLTGCYNYREINDLAITTAIGIDKKEDGYNMVFQVVNTQKNGSDSNASVNPKIVIYESFGKTTQEATQKVVLESPRKIYTNHLLLLIISEEVAKEGIDEVLDFLFRDTESRKQYAVMISQNTKSKDILEILTPLETINAQNILSSIMSDEQYYGLSQNINFEQLMEMYLNNKKEILLPSIKLVGSSDEGEKKEDIEQSNTKAKLVLSNMAIFKNNKLLGYTTEEESIALNFIKGEINSTLITLPCEDNKDKYMSIELQDIESKTNAKKNKLEINLEIKADGSINEIYCDVNLEKIKEIKKIEKYLENHLENQIKNSIKSINQKYQSDIYGFRDLFYKTNPKFYNKIKNNYYEKHFNNIKINTNIDINLTKKGSITRVINNDK